MNGYLSVINQTVAALMTFFVAMLLYPDVQKKAQDELDSVIGRERLPTFDDRPRLPFIDAMCKETLRWHPVTPLSAFSPIPVEDSEWCDIACVTSSLAGIPHAATKDNVYAGFFIPKGEPDALMNLPGFRPRILSRRVGDRKCMVSHILQAPYGLEVENFSGLCYTTLSCIPSQIYSNRRDS